MSRKLLKYNTIRGTIVCETGLRIGGSKENIEIGGMDNPILRHPITDEPYIPGSSLKGKIRSLLEYKYDRRDSRNQPKIGFLDNGEPCECGKCMICRVFGPHKNLRHGLGPTRAIFRDAKLTAKSLQWLQNANTERGINYVEDKTENRINRLTGAAFDPRPQERVPEGTDFDFEISIRIFDDDTEKEVMDLINEGLDLLQQDYLGGSGSRGYGKVKINIQAA